MPGQSGRTAARFVQPEPVCIISAAIAITISLLGRGTVKPIVKYFADSEIEPRRKCDPDRKFSHMRDRPGGVIRGRRVRRPAAGRAPFCAPARPAHSVADSGERRGAAAPAGHSIPTVQRQPCPRSNSAAASPAPGSSSELVRWEMAHPVAGCPESKKGGQRPPLRNWDARRRIRPAVPPRPRGC